ncbi:amino acid adenylation domain-containing protein, partial [Salmonella enterica subsp. enterica]|nr:amino acid adenylation domain-containing protein [Salmonella enterica subsp. enterica]
MRTAYETLINANKIGITLWLAENDKLKYKATNHPETEATLKEIVAYKNEIIDLLKRNGIVSEEQPFPFIYRCEREPAALSFAQERLWFIEQYEGGTNAYHVPRVYQLRQSANIEAIKSAIRAIVSRHEVLRSTINKQGDETVQCLHDMPLEIEACTVNSNDELLAIVRKDISKPFDLGSEYPIRAKLYYVHAGGHTQTKSNIDVFLLINIHHIATDGWSMDCFQRELKLCYAAFAAGSIDSMKLPFLPVQYKDYAVWQREYLQGEVLQEQIEYWVNKLSGFESLNLQSDYTRPKNLEYHGKRKYFTLDKQASAQLQALSKEHGTTLHVMLLSIFSILLSKYTGQGDIVTGSPIANRHHDQIKDLIGYFVNTQVNRIKIDPHRNCKELFEQVHHEQAASQRYQDLPFEKLVELLQIERDLGRHPIFQVMFGVQSFGKVLDRTDEDTSSPVFLCEDINQQNEIAAFDISLFVDCSAEAFEGMISYKTSLFSESTIEKLIKHYCFIIDQILKNPCQSISELTLLSPDEYQQVVYKWNQTANEAALTKSINQRFLEQVEKNPDSIALVCNESFLSYQELNHKANQLAAHLQRTLSINGVLTSGKKVKIGLLLDRSPEMIIAMLAILKCGAVYVPMDPDYPQQRLEHIVSDTEAALILTLRHTVEHQSVEKQKGLRLDSYQAFDNKFLFIDLDEPLYTLESNDVAENACPEDLAYVIYTSGTAGNPKGVLISHANITSLVFSDFIQVNSSDNFLFLSSPVFDAATFEIWMPLLHGGKLIIPADTKSLVASPETFGKLIDSQNISILWLTKTLFENLYLIKPDLFKNLNYLLVGGEALNKDIINSLIESVYSPKNLLNGYGPTESTTFTCVYPMNKQICSANVPIGKPMKGRTCYVLDSNEKPVPVGVIGELFIGGDGLAHGYLNNPELTAKKFIADKFGNPVSAGYQQPKLYKTGDLVRWMPDGNIEYIGRKDGQVKIRGYRIELSEIENKLKKLAGIEQVAVLMKTREADNLSNKILVAYYTTDKTLSLSPQNITNYLVAQLPDYMVPNAFVELDAFPVTVNGKLNIKALPEPRYAIEQDYTAPNSDLERSVCEIYADVLGIPVDEVSINGNFFSMGGNSILSMRLKHKLNQVSEFESLSIADLFKFNSVQKLVASIENDSDSDYKIQNHISHADDKIAIIGLSGSFSGVDHMDDLWSLVSHQKEGVIFCSKEECIALGVSEEKLANPDYIPIATHVRNTDKFDPQFWGMSPNEAKLLDPQIRKFMEHCWVALESSGYITQRKSRLIGVFAGSGTDHYFQNNIVERTKSGEIDLWEASVSNRKDSLTTKAAYFLGLTGPAISINTSCSTGLVSIIEACRNIQLGTCDMALAGGVSLTMPEEIGYTYTEGMIMSRDGHCRPFDQSASGTIPASGVAVVLLKRLSAAIQDNDEILGVVSGYASNNDGDRKTSYTAPSLIGQSECIINAYEMAEINSCDVDYIECHGTATHLGDPIEVQALKEAFQYKSAQRKRLNRTVLGAVKANLGHTDAASGVAGVIKVVQMLKNEIIPGQTNFSSANVELNLEKTPFEIITQNKPWTASSKPRIAGVSSFGIGGTNAHIVIQDLSGSHVQRPLLEVNAQEAHGPFIIPISAKSRTALDYNKSALLAYIQKNKGKDQFIKNLAFTLQHNREHYEFRSAYVAADVKELIHLINNDKSYNQIPFEQDNKVVFMFPGQGTQYTNMGKRLYENEPKFAEIVDQCIALANQYLSTDVRDVLFKENCIQNNDINSTEWTQICLFIIEYSLARYLQLLDVKADAYMGHSIGEYVAATLSEMFSLEDAIKLVIARGQLMQSMQPGNMLAVKGKLTDIQHAVAAHVCEVAVINSHEDSVISGLKENIQALQSTLTELGLPSVLLTTSHAYHSRMMESSAHHLKNFLADVAINAPTKPFVTNLTGKMATSTIQTAEYWCDQLRNTVRFADCIATLSEYFNHKVTFIEVGCGKGLSSFVNKFKEYDNRKNIHTYDILPSINGCQEHDVKNGTELLTILWKNNQLSFDAPVFASQLSTGKNLSDCPTYQFDLQKCWFEKPLLEATHTKLQLLDKKHWYSVPQWSSCKVFKQSNDNSLFKKALILLRHDQLQYERYTALADEFMVIKLDANATEYGAGDNCIIINPESEQHFAKLRAYIADSDHDAIIHAASIDNSDMLESALSYGFYSLFLTRSYLLNATQFKKFLVLTNGITQLIETDRINAANATMVGAVRNIKHEFSHIKTGLLDVGEVNEHSTSQIKQVFSEEDSYQVNTLFAIKFGKLWQETYVRINPSEFINQDVITDGDVILITGGMGGVALSIAKTISEKHHVTFILLSRNDIYQIHSPSDYVKQKLALIEQIKCNGSVVLTHAVDIGNDDSFNRALLNKLALNKDITGVIHTAGVEPLAPEHYNIQNVKRALAGKVYGLRNILQYINIDKLKYLACTSSLASILGDVNRIEYCAANSYLDYLAVDRNKLGSTHVVSINWPGWSDIGIVRNNEEANVNGPRDDDKLRALISLNAVQQNEGASIFYDLMQQPYSQVVFSKLDIQLLENTLFKPLTSVENDTSRNVVILEEAHTEQEAIVAQLFAEVLGVERLSVDDDFFRIGGNSILAIQLSHKISRNLNFDIRVADIFKYRTIRNILSSVSIEDRIEIPKQTAKNVVLSFAQQRLWFIEQYEQGTNAYHIPSLYKLKSNSNIAHLEQAISDIVVRHEVLRSVIHQDDNFEFGMQMVCDNPLKIDHEVLLDRTVLDTLIARDIAKPFNLSAEYPIRVKLYVLAVQSEKEHILLVNMHHIATDGWSMDIFLRELAALYRAYSANKPLVLPSLPIQYKDFAQWQRQYLRGEVLQKQLDYWKRKLTGFSTLELPGDYQRPVQVDYKGGHQVFTLSVETSQAIKALAKAEQTTVHTILLTAFSILLSKLANQSDIVTGSPIANRHYAQIKDLIGLFINTQVNRIEVDQTTTYNQLIRHVHQDQVDGQQYQDVPFEKLVEELDVDRDLSRHPIFQVMFGVQSFGQLDSSEGWVSDLPLLPYEIDKSADEISRFDLALFINDSREQIQGYMAYKTSLFKQQTISRYIDRFVCLLEGLLQSPDKAINQFSLLSQAERDLIISDWNNTQFDYPKQATVNQLFQFQAELKPDEVALVYRDMRLTYQELNEKSNALANILRKTYKDRTGSDIKAGKL